MSLTLSDINALTQGRYGVCDVPCPMCGPEKRSGTNRRRKVLRIWQNTADFATFCCKRCGAEGYAREDGAPAPDPVKLAKARAEAQRFAATAAEAKRSKAQWLWANRRPISGTPA